MSEPTNPKIELETMRHSLAHILAMAVLRLYPHAKIGIGPAVENGFYYEVDAGARLAYKDLEKIEAEMHKIIAEALPFKQFFTPKDQAFDTLLQAGQIYKSELLQQIPDEQVSFFRTGEFFDLCRGPHVSDTSKVGSFKLTKISNSYWMGQKSRPKLQKIEGVAFNKKQELDEFLTLQQELAQRDYKKIGRNLKLLLFDEDLGSEFTTWMPRGNLIKEITSDYIFKLLDLQNFERIQTPALAKFTLYRDYFEDEKLKKEYLPIMKCDDNEYLIRKNAFYQHSIVFKSLKRSYKHLPVKFSELINSYYVAHNNAASSIRHRQGIQTHTFLLPGQVTAEIELMLNLLDQIYSTIGISGVQIQAKLPDEKSDPHILELAKIAVPYLQQALANQKRVAKITVGEHCNEGGELFFFVKDIHGNQVEIATLKVDTVSAVKERITYINKNNQPETPIILQTNVLSSFDNLFKLLLEQNLGAFQVWMSAVQVVIISISEKYNHNAQEVYNFLKKAGIRVEINLENEPMQAKIRSAEQENIPYMLIVGEKEIRTNSVSIRQRNGQELGLVRIEEFVNRLHDDLFPKIA